MQKTVSLSQFVKRRNGVALGGAHSMSNMFKRALGASSFPLFWRHWNPIWSYYLSRHVMKPLHRILPTSLAIFLTFIVSGAIHDIAVMLVKWKPIIFFTPWFALMGLWVIVSAKAAVTYSHYSWPVRAAINITPISITLGLTIAAEHLWI